jgi:hypothetical protein
MEEVGTFDLHAAFLRRAQHDIKSFLEAFATRLEQSLPGQVEVHRKKDSLFAKTSHVAGITIHLGSNRFVLENSGNGLHLSRCNEVRGIVLKNEELQLPDWLASLNKELGAMSANMAGAQGILHEFLMN